MTDASDQMSVINKIEDPKPAGFNEYEMEKQRFNTGPCASKTFPAQFNMVTGGSQMVESIQQQNRSAHNSPEEPAMNLANLAPQPQISSNDSSNLSSDKELEIVLINTTKGGGGGSSSSQPPFAEIKGHGRKRKRLEFNKSEATPRPGELNKNDRKITDYIRVKTSPKRPNVNFPNTNGNSLSNDGVQLTPLCTSPIQCFQLNNQNQQQLQHQIAVATKPSSNQNITAYSSTSSDSNQSPPSNTKTERGVQTSEIQILDPQAEMGTGKSAAAAMVDEKKTNNANASEVEALMRANAELKQTNSELKQTLERKVQASKETIMRLLIEQSRMQRKQAKERVMEGTLRIGQFKPARVGEHFKDQWTPGWAMEENKKKMDRIDSEIKKIELDSKNLKKLKSTKNSKRQQQNSTAQMPPPSTSSYTDDGFLRPELPKEMTVQEYIEQEEIYRLRKEHLKNEENEAKAEKARLEREMHLHIREMKRVQCEEQSRFKEWELLNGRYLPLSLLGKGGFSEVWRAFDLEENRYVACKIHQVNKEWKEDKKANYVKHAMREKDIHKSLDHPRIVRLFDLFTIDNDSFCTVLEYCDGNDLDYYLKQNKQIPEKEARCIIMQVVSALKYLSEQKCPIIHYDLKPANILLQSGTTSGEIKLTDFGLSKTIANTEDDDASIELTSQGAGTYWYLPPEAFVTRSVDGGPPKISNKVDVWSVGIIFYQCIYGIRPFAHEQTQQQILENQSILHAEEVNFPPKPPVSAFAQDFIRRCLQRNKAERADVGELMRHDLFKTRGQKSQQPPSPSAKLGGKMDQSDE